MTAPRLFRYGGHAAGVPLGVLAERDPSIVRFRITAATIVRDADRLEAMILDMLEAALHGAGDHFVAGRSAAIDRIVEARGRLANVFDTVLQGGARPDVAQDLKMLDQLYRDLEDGMATLRRPLAKAPPPEGLAQRIAAAFKSEAGLGKRLKLPQQRRTAAADLAREAGSSRSRIARHGFRKRQGTEILVKRFKDKAWAELTLENGKFRVATFNAAGNPTGIFREFEAVPTRYGALPRTSRIMQFNHGYQTALMEDVFGALYDPNAFPTMCLRDNKSGSPHGIITAIQARELAGRRARGLTFADIRRYAIDEMTTAGASPEEIARYLALADHVVATTIVPKLKPGEIGLLGGWTPGRAP